MELTRAFDYIDIFSSHAIVLSQVFRPGFDHEILDKTIGLCGIVEKTPENGSISVFSFLRNPAERTDFWDPVK